MLHLLRNEDATPDLLSASRDSDPLGNLVARLPRLHRVLLGACNGTGTDWGRDDIVQQVLLALLKQRRTTDSQSERELEAYAKCAARHRLSNARRRDHRARLREQEWARHSDRHVGGADELLTKVEATARCHSLIGRLPEDLAAVVVARDLSELSVAQTAVLLRMTEAAVKSRHRRAFTMLKNLAQKILNRE